MFGVETSPPLGYFSPSFEYKVTGPGGLILPTTLTSAEKKNLISAERERERERVVLREIPSIPNLQRQTCAISNVRTMKASNVAIYAERFIWKKETILGGMHMAPFSGLRS
jgi:hypothetical protein